MPPPASRSDQGGPNVEIYLVRHAEAVVGEPDELRPLTPGGREQARRLGERLRDEGVEASVVLASPLLRARETGALIARALGAELAIDEALAPGATAESLTRAARRVVRPGTRAIVAVGHQPDCSRIASALTGEPHVPFPPAGARQILVQA